MFDLTSLLGSAIGRIVGQSILRIALTPEPLAVVLPRRRPGLGEAEDDKIRIESAYDLIKALAIEAGDKAQSYKTAATVWGAAHVALGAPAAIIGAVAGATGLVSATSRVLAAVLAFVAAGLAACVAFLNSDEHQKRATALQAVWSGFHGDCLGVLAYAKEDSAADTLRPKVEELIKTRRNILTGKAT